MKKTIQKSTFALIVMLLSMMHLAGACVLNPFAISGNGKMVTEQRQVSNFSAMEVSSAFSVELSQGDAESLTIEADENLMKFIRTEVRGGVLKIYVDEPVNSSRGLKAILNFKSLESMDFSGAVKVKGMNSLHFDQLEVELSGATELDMDMTASSLDLDVSGASKISLVGEVKHVDADCSGASKIYAENLKTSTFNFESSGASKAEIWVTDELRVSASGASSVRYKGEVQKIKVDTSGASSVEKM
ncbi:MAG: DUF2807 domain-containing protein [Bacteroidales bacterium]|nr:DUF2807 domain-containing protein [Bacteroidales bacterium]